MKGASRLRTVALSFAGIVTAGSSSVVAHAQTSSSAVPGSLAAAGSSTARSEARRTTLYELGVAAAAANRWAEARERFQATLDIRSSPKVLFTLGEADEHLGQFASAQASYEHAIEQARMVPGESDVVRIALAAIHQVEPRVPHLRVTTPGVDAAMVTLDGHRLGVGARVALDPGTHQLDARGAGYVSVSMNVAVGIGGELEVPIRLEQEVTANALTRPPTPESLHARPTSSAAPRGSSALRTAGIAGAAAGVVTLGIGTYFALQAKAKNDDSYAAGCAGNICPSGGLALRQDSLSAARVATGTIIAGGLLVAAGVTVWWLAPSTSRPTALGLRTSAFGGTGGTLALVGTWP